MSKPILWEPGLRRIYLLFSAVVVLTVGVIVFQHARKAILEYRGLPDRISAYDTRIEYQREIIAEYEARLRHLKSLPLPDDVDAINRKFAKGVGLATAPVLTRDGALTTATRPDRPRSRLRWESHIPEDSLLRVSVRWNADDLETLHSFPMPQHQDPYTRETIRHVENELNYHEGESQRLEELQSRLIATREKHTLLSYAEPRIYPYYLYFLLALIPWIVHYLLKFVVIPVFSWVARGFRPT